jgi:prepilin-type N-terminal cleavage/methylation domain-containing protein
MNRLRLRFRRRLSQAGGKDACQAGFTLIELLVAMVLMTILGGVIITILTASRSSAGATTAQLDLTAEARTALNRIAGDLHGAVPLTNSTTGLITPAITAVANPDGPGYNPAAVTSVTFNLDVSGDGCVNGIASSNVSPAATTACSKTSPPVDLNQPETETICWDPTSQQVYLLAVDPTATDETIPTTNCGGGVPLLAGRVSAFKLSYRSSLYRYQNLSGSDPSAGITTWYDLDAANPPVGDKDAILNSTELLEVDSVIIDMTLSESGHVQNFTTGSDLRNVHPDA